MGFALYYSYWVKKFLINNLSIYYFVNNSLIFLFSFLTRLGDFLLIDLPDFFFQFFSKLEGFLLNYK